MASTIVRVDKVVTGTAGWLGQADNLTVMRDILLASTDGSGIVVEGSGSNTQINGSLVAQTTAFMTDESANSTTLFIGAMGSIVSHESAYASHGIALRGSNSVMVNHGQISAAQAIATMVRGENSQVVNTGQVSGISGFQFYFDSVNSTLSNSGTIMATGDSDRMREVFDGRGILVQSADLVLSNSVSGVIGSSAVDGSAINAVNLAGGLTIRNYGEIFASHGTAIDLAFVAEFQDVVKVTNWGEIWGGNSAFMGSANYDHLVNRGVMSGDVLAGAGDDFIDNRNGLIEGDVDLDDGDDVFDGRLGEVTGTVYGWRGDDVFRGNANRAETFDAGPGSHDLLDFLGGRAVVVALDGSFSNRGAAAGDTYIEFEDVNGSAFDDRITGSAGSNTLSGNNGVDILSGGAGADTLIGGRGADKLIGGAGADTFLFNDLSERGDRILDFGSVSGKSDQIAINADNFGAGLVEGEVTAAMFSARGDNVAQDGSDRFILRTTDKTLWFDADGSGSGAAVMIADMQDSAVFSRFDIVLI